VLAQYNIIRWLFYKTGKDIVQPGKKLLRISIPLFYTKDDQSGPTIYIFIFLSFFFHGSSLLLPSSKEEGRKERGRKQQRRILLYDFQDLIIFHSDVRRCGY